MTDPDKVRREVEKSLASEHVSEATALVDRLLLVPRKTARVSGFYDAMTHGVSNHVVWDAEDLTNLLKAVPTGSIGFPVVNIGCPEVIPYPAIPLDFRKNKVRIAELGYTGCVISDGEFAYLVENQQLLSALHFQAQDEGQFKMVEKLVNLRKLTIGTTNDVGITTFRCNCSSLVELNLMGRGVVGISWDTPPVNLEKLALFNVRKVASLDWLSQCRSLTSIRIAGGLNLNRVEVCCESLVLPDSVETVDFFGINGFKHLECGRSARKIYVAGCVMLESICLRKALSMGSVELYRLGNLVQVDSPRYMPSLDAQSIRSVQDGDYKAQWWSGIAEWTGLEVDEIG